MLYVLALDGSSSQLRTGARSDYSSDALDEARCHLLHLGHGDANVCAMGHVTNPYTFPKAVHAPECLDIAILA